MPTGASRIGNTDKGNRMSETYERPSWDDYFLEIANTVAEENEVDDELNHLFAVLQGKEGRRTTE